MKNQLLVLIAIIISSAQLAYSQCTPNPQYTTMGTYPDINVGLPNGSIGNNYSTVITIVLDTPSLGIEYLQIDSISGLPQGLSYMCNPPNGHLALGQSYCLIITGTPLTGTIGIHPINIYGMFYHEDGFAYIPYGFTGYTITILATNLLTAEFTISANSECADSAIVFNNTSINATSYSWTFPGGTPSSSTLINPVVTYADPGNYTAILTAFDNGNTDVYTENITITDCARYGLVNGGFEDWDIVDSMAFDFDLGATGGMRRVSRHVPSGWSVDHYYQSPTALNSIWNLKTFITYSNSIFHGGSNALTLSFADVYEGLSGSWGGQPWCSMGEIRQSIAFAEPTTVKGIKFWYRTTGNNNLGVELNGKIFYKPNGHNQWNLDSLIYDNPQTTTTFSIGLRAAANLLLGGTNYTEYYEDYNASYPCYGSIRVDDVELILDGPTGINSPTEKESSLLSVANSQSGEVWLTYTVTENSPVKIQLYNLEGKVIKEVVNETHTPGTYRVDLKEMGLPAGLYVADMLTKSQRNVAKAFIP